MTSGCATLMTPFQVKTPIPASLTTDCPPLPKLESNSVEALIDLFIEVTGMYHECADDKKALAAAVKNRDK